MSGLSDTPGLAELHQAERPAPIDVEVLGQPTVDQAPRFVGAGRRRTLPVASGSYRLLGDDQRRARVNLFVHLPSNAAEGGIMIGGSQAEVDLFRGCYLRGATSANPFNPMIRHQFNISSELWVRPAAISSTGAFSAAPVVVIVEYMTEMWSR